MDERNIGLMKVGRKGYWVMIREGIFRGLYYVVKGEEVFYGIIYKIYSIVSLLC
jgi:hypothetical protein